MPKVPIQVFSRVVVEGPQRCLLLVGFSCNVGWGNWKPQVAQIFAYRKCCYTARSIWTNVSAKRVISRNDVPISGLNYAPYILEVKPPKTAF